MPAAKHPAQTLSAERYVSADFAEREWEAAWARSWLLLGHSSEMEEAGDFLVEEIGRESIIAMRQPDGSAKAFYNVCPHRGNQLLVSSEGHVPAITCGYHGWRFALDGLCVSAQDAEDFPVNPCGQARLAELLCEELGGFVWVNMDPDAMPLRAYLGPAWDVMSVYPMTEYRRIAANSVRMPCNWKAALDNFHEAYHVACAHSIGLHYMEDDYRQTRMELYGNGHALSVAPTVTQAQRLPAGTPLGPQVKQELEAWGLDPAVFAGRECETRLAVQQQKRKLWRERGYAHYENYADYQLTDTCHVTIFPNVAMTFNPDGMAFIRATPHPRDPEQCILDSWLYAVGQGSYWNKMLATNPAQGSDHHVPRDFTDFGAHSLGPVLDDDAWVLAAQQKGIRSRGYRGAMLAGQERRVAQYHAMLDHLMAGGSFEHIGPPALRAAE